MIYVIVFISMIAFTGGAIFAFYWAAKHGQFRQFENGSQSIFDADEAVGKRTDEFPKHW